MQSCIASSLPKKRFPVHDIPGPNGSGIAEIPVGAIPSMRSLKIIHTESSCGWGGQELRVLAESHGMVVRGHDVLIAAPAEAPIFKEAVARGIATAPIPMAKKGLAGLGALRSLLKRHGADLVVTHSSTDSWLAALACASLRRAPPLVRTRHVSAPISGNAATRWLYRKASKHVVTTGEALRLQVMREAGLPASQVTSVPTGIDLQRFRPGDRMAARRQLNLPADCFIIGIVATLRSWKGHRYLVDAMAALGDPGSLLVIVGDGPGRDNLRSQVQALDLAGRVLMAGNQTEVELWMQAFDVFVLPSYANEGVPQSLMQAMACGLPVISTPVGAISEILDDGGTGLMVPPRDASALCSAIRRLRDDEILRKSLSDAELLRARECFAADRMIDAMELVFQKVLAA